MAEQDLRSGLDACDHLSQVLYLLHKSVKTARKPIDNGEWDFVTIGGELTDIQEHLHDAQRHNSAVRSSFVELIALVRRLQVAYHGAYESYQDALGQVEAAYNQGQINMLYQLIADLAESDLDLLFAVVKMLSASETNDQQAVRDRLHHLLTTGEVEGNQE